jgi:hypothetical protein
MGGSLPRRSGLGVDEEWGRLRHLHKRQVNVC